MIVVALSVIVQTGVFLVTLGFSIRHSQAEILRENAESIYTSMKTGRDYHPPYGLSWLVYDSFTRMVYTTNDPFLPTLPDTHGAVKQYFVNDYFSDGDLHLRYYAVDVFPFTIVTAIDLDSDFLFSELDSLGVTTILMVLSEEFGIHLESTDATSKNLRNIDSIVKMVEEKLKEK